MVSFEDVENFLKGFNCKILVFGIVFRDDRDKNFQSLFALEITPKYREDVIRTLCAEDYVEGPIPDKLNRLGDMWVFGKDVKGTDVYIKISMGKPNSQTICISFHIAEQQLNYKFKQT